MATSTLFEMDNPSGRIQRYRTDKLRTKPTKSQFTQEQIQAIYNAYPRHKEPGLAFKAIEAALSRIESPEPAVELLAIVKEYASACEGKDKRYILYPARWFDRKCYLEDPAEWGE